MGNLLIASIAFAFRLRAANGARPRAASFFNFNSRSNRLARWNVRGTIRERSRALARKVGKRNVTDETTSSSPIGCPKDAQKDTRSVYRSRLEKGTTINRISTHILERLSQIYLTKDRPFSLVIFPTKRRRERKEKKK